MRPLPRPRGRNNCPYPQPGHERCSSGRRPSSARHPRDSHSVIGSPQNRQDRSSAKRRA
jgi:hypothetical protein